MGVFLERRQEKHQQKPHLFLSRVIEKIKRKINKHWQNTSFSFLYRRFITNWITIFFSPMWRFRVVAPLDVFSGLYNNQHTNLYHVYSHSSSIYSEQYTNKLIPCDVQSLIIEFLLLLGFGRYHQTGLVCQYNVGNFFLPQQRIRRESAI
jgi:hypothetical protein